MPERSGLLSGVPGACSIAMGTGIVSVALLFDHRHWLSRAWLVAALLAWLLLGALTVARLFVDRSGLRAAAAQPSALAAVAATAVLGSRLELAGLRTAAIVGLVAGGGMVAMLTWMLAGRHRIGRSGSSFLLTVALEALAGLMALLAGSGHAAWLWYFALVLAASGVAAYPIVLRRFSLHQLLSGRGDHWIAGGALAVSALTLAELRLSPRGHLISALSTISIAVWLASLAWLAALLVAELVRPRLRYDLRRWSTLFPVGMYAASGFEVARAAHLGWPYDFATVWTWFGVGLTLVLGVGALKRLVAGLA